MTRLRKTIQVASLKDEVNGMLEHPKVHREVKRVLCTVLEGWLMETGNYRGFQWNLSHEEAVAVQPEDEPYYNRHYA